MPDSPAVRLKDKKIIARGWGTLTSHTIEVRRRDGTEQELVREVYDHGSAAAILLLDPDRAMVMLVRQFRLPAHLDGDGGYLIETCAGLLDGNTPEDCARREAIEETGIAPRAIVHAFDLYASPGSLTEKVHCFTGLYTPQDRVGPGGGLDDEGEDIEIVELGFDQALAMIGSGEIVDAKTVALIQHAALKGFPARWSPAPDPAPG